MLRRSLSSGIFDAPVGTDIAWCPGCGNFPILTHIKKVLEETGKSPSEIVFVSGIGQAGKFPQYVRTHYFNGLHGRAIPVATGIKAANPSLTVIVESGDGDIYGEGGNHLLHAFRRNSDITCIVHDNMIYGLTKGQASPTSEEGLVTPVQPRGVQENPLNPIALAISMECSFVARTSAGNPEHLRSVVSRAILHKGFSLVDVFQPCTVFNTVNTYKWFSEHTEILPDDYDLGDRAAAFARIVEEENRGVFGLGVYYQNENRPTFEEMTGAYSNDERPLWKREVNEAALAALIAAKG